MLLALLIPELSDLALVTGNLRPKQGVLILGKGQPQDTLDRSYKTLGERARIVVVRIYSLDFPAKPQDKKQSWHR